MATYRLYFIGRDGHFEKAIPFESPNEDEAIAAADDLADGRPMELWRAQRRLKVYEATDERRAQR